ncbi:hypothetical protein [Celeribacter sp.]|uniref:hypothetical protein n=1 Tax=Celeribacter sp. TaxID=1890673 RepID=UPI003A9053B3
MSNTTLTRRGFMAAGFAGLSLSALPLSSALANPALSRPPLRVILALLQSNALTHTLQDAGCVVTQSDTGAFLTDPARLNALKGQRVMLIGREADLVLFDLALGDHAPKARVIHRARHQMPRTDPTDGWQAQNLSKVLAETLNQPHSEMTWTDAPSAFSTLIADL